MDVALSYFNEAGRHVVDNIIQKLSSGTAPELASEIELSIQARLDDLDFTPDCSSHIDYKSEPESATLQSAHFHSVAEIRIVASDADSVTFPLSIDADIDFGAHFNFHAYDGIDKDYVTLSSEYAERTQAKTIKLIIAAQRIVDPEPVTISVEAFLPKYYSVDFGYIEPISDEDPTHEKY